LVLSRILNASLIVLVAAAVLPAADAGLVTGSIALAAGAPGAGIDLRLVDVASGRAITATSDADGRFRAPLPAGVYSVEARGYAVTGGPRVVTSIRGREATAALVLAPLAADASGLSLRHAPVGCLIAEEHLEIDATIRPAAKVKHARVYFKAKGEQDYHYVEMVPEIGRFVACLPRPHAYTGPIDYYVEAASGAGETARSEDVSALVIRRADECPADRRTAVVCPCRVPVAVYSPTGQPVFPGAFGGIAGQVGGTVGSQIAGTAALVAIGAGAIGVTIVLQEPAPASPSR
jgi:hypothetical protein